jgi:DnaJ-domain-containing protein 1
VDLVKLEVSFKALQRKIHPDKFATASAEERAHAEQVRQPTPMREYPLPPSLSLRRERTRSR